MVKAGNRYHITEHSMLCFSHKDIFLLFDSWAFGISRRNRLMRKFLTIALYSLDNMNKLLCHIGEKKVAQETDAEKNQTLEAESNFTIE